MRHLTVDVDAKRDMRVRGRGRWAKAGDAWLCAHDILHHLPTDTGEIFQEAMTFGAELWLDYEVNGLDAITWTSLTGTLADGYKGPRSFNQFLLPAVPVKFRRPLPYVMEKFSATAREALDDFRMWVAGHYDECSDRTPAQARLDLLNSEVNQGRYVDWMAAGYRIAQRRYPDASAAHRLFQAVLQRLQRSSARSIDLAIDERACTLLPMS